MLTPPMAKTTYKDAGVDLERYEESMRRLPRWLHRTYSPRVIPADGGFAGLFQLDFFHHRLFARSYDEPVLVAGTDGVGTKLKIAQQTGMHDTVGIDLVAMCVNDIICCGAEPLFFLDYVAMDADDPVRLEEIVRGISDGCMEADCALLGGETAIMPDLYAPGDYDLAGFCVGVVERRQLIDGRAIIPGDQLVGVASNGFHSNGFSLVRKVVLEQAGMDLSQTVGPAGRSLGEILLTPTRIYARPLRRLLLHYTVKQVVHGVAHITGGGLAENIGRILPPGRRVVIDRAAWDVPPLFRWLQELGEIDESEMFRVFNMGIGLVLVVRPFFLATARRFFEEAGIATQVIGEVTEGERSVVWKDAD